MREQNIAFKQRLRESKLKTTRRHNLQMTLFYALAIVGATLAVLAIQFGR